MLPLRSRTVRNERFPMWGGMNPPRLMYEMFSAKTLSCREAQVMPYQSQMEEPVVQFRIKKSVSGLSEVKLDLRARREVASVVMLS